MKIEKKLLEIPFDCIKDLVTEPCIQFNSEGMSINAFADSNIAMVIFNLPKEKFIEYNFESEERFKIDIEMLSKIMKRIKTKNINLDFKDQRIIISDEKGKEYAIAVMHDDETKRDMPKLDLKSNFKIPCAKLQDLFADANIVSEELKIEVKENKIKISSGKLNKFYYELDCNINGEAISNYSLEYLNKIMNASKYFEEVLFEFGSNLPCKLTFKGDLEIQFILAARCE